MSGDAKFTVFVDDNFHYMDESYRYTAEAFDDADDAIACCRAIVEASLRGSYRPGMTPEELFANYKHFGEDPFVLGGDTAGRFSAWTYAKERCPSFIAERRAAVGDEPTI